MCRSTGRAHRQNVFAIFSLALEASHLENGHGDVDHDLDRLYPSLPLRDVVQDPSSTDPTQEAFSTARRIYGSTRQQQTRTKTKKQTNKHKHKTTQAHTGARGDGKRRIASETKTALLFILQPRTTF